MLAIEETILPNGEINYSLSEPYDIGARFDPKYSKNTVKLNLDSLVDCFDAVECYEEFWASCDAAAAEAVKRGEVIERHPHYYYDVDYYIRRAPHEIVHGFFLHFSDDGDCRLERESVISLTIDGKKHELSTFFSPSPSSRTPDVYIKITPELLRELSAAASISLTFEYKQEGFKDKEFDFLEYEGTQEGFKDKKIDDFQKYALAYYKGYYIEHQGTPEEKSQPEREKAAL